MCLHVKWLPRITNRRASLVRYSYSRCLLTIIVLNRCFSVLTWSFIINNLHHCPCAASFPIVVRQLRARARVFLPLKHLSTLCATTLPVTRLRDSLEMGRHFVYTRLPNTMHFVYTRCFPSVTRSAVERYRHCCSLGRLVYIFIT